MTRRCSGSAAAIANARTAQTTAMTPPQANDDLTVARPMPSERKGRRSPKRMMSKSAMAHTQFNDSLQAAAGKEWGG